MDLFIYYKIDGPSSHSIQIGKHWELKHITPDLYQLELKVDKHSGVDVLNNFLCTVQLPIPSSHQDRFIKRNSVCRLLKSSIVPHLLNWPT